MSTLAQIGGGLEKAWDSLADGWRQLQRRASQAITRFSPGKKTGNLETADELFIERVSRWGMLAAEMRETDSEVVVRIEVPGLESDNFDIQVVNNVLVVRGDKRVEREQTQGRFHVMECAYGQFERAIPLPVEVDENAARAKYRRGVLQVRLPRAATAKARRIEIRSEQ